MEFDIPAGLRRIEETQRAMATVLQTQGGTLQIVIRHLAEIVDLLRPNDAGGSAPLDELLAHLIGQNAEQLRLMHDLVEAMSRLERELPTKVTRGLAHTNGAANPTQ